jgi:hypothetical protein
MALLISVKRKRPTGPKGHSLKALFRHDFAALAFARAKRSSHALTLVSPEETFCKSFDVNREKRRAIRVHPCLSAVRLEFSDFPILDVLRDSTDDTHIRLHRNTASTCHTNVRARLQSCRKATDFS